MTRLNWKQSSDPRSYEHIAEIGMLKYKIGQAHRTPGHRVFCYFNDKSASVGGLPITLSAPSLNAAKDAAQQHFDAFVASLTGE